MFLGKTFDPIYSGHKKDAKTILNYLSISSRLYYLSILVASFFVNYVMYRTLFSKNGDTIAMILLLVSSALLMYVFSVYRELVKVSKVSMLWKVLFAIWLVLFLLINIVQLFAIPLSLPAFVMVVTTVFSMVGEFLLNRLKVTEEFNTLKNIN